VGPRRRLGISPRRAMPARLRGEASISSISGPAVCCRLAREGRRSPSLQAPSAGAYRRLRHVGRTASASKSYTFPPRASRRGEAIGRRLEPRTFAALKRPDLGNHSAQASEEEGGAHADATRRGAAAGSPLSRPSPLRASSSRASATGARAGRPRDDHRPGSATRGRDGRSRRKHQACPLA